MAVAALVVTVAWLVLVIVVRSLVTYRRSGTVPTPPHAPPGSPRWWARLAIQARKVEEPFLLEKYGDEYRRYASATGRFVPGIGRMS